MEDWEFSCCNTQVGEIAKYPGTKAENDTE